MERCAVGTAESSEDGGWKVDKGRAPTGRTGADTGGGTAPRALTVPERERERTRPGAEGGGTGEGAVTISNSTGDEGSASDAAGLGLTATILGICIGGSRKSSTSLSLRSIGGGREIGRAAGGIGGRDGIALGTGGGANAGGGAGAAEGTW